MPIKTERAHYRGREPAVEIGDEARPCSEGKIVAKPLFSGLPEAGPARTSRPRQSIVARARLE